MFWCCCNVAESCLIAAPVPTTLQGVINVSNTAHPNAAVSGWIPRGRMVGSISTSNSSSMIDLVYQWKDTANYDYIRCQRGSSSSEWLLTLVTRRSNSETQLQFRNVSAPTIGATFCVQWNGTTVGIAFGDAAGATWYGYVEFNAAPTLTNGGNVGTRNQLSGTSTITEFWRHYTEGPLNSQQCPSCVGGGVCDGCCIALSTSWSADLSGFALTNQNFTGCTDVDGVYILDALVGVPCEFQATRRLQRYEYSEPQLGATNCYSRDIVGVSCFDPSIQVRLKVSKIATVCTIELTIALTWAIVGVPCDTCQFRVIAYYKATSANIDALCNGSVVLNYVSKDPQICAGNPPATVTVTGL